MTRAGVPVAHRPAGRRELKKHLTRRELLAAGRRLFGRKGLYESRIEDLSRQAGIAKGTLYGYFASKEELVEAVVSSGFSELLAFSRHAVRDSDSYLDVVRGIVEAHMVFFAENPDLMRVFHQVRGLLKFKRPEGVRLRKVLALHLAEIARLLAPHHPVRNLEPEKLLETASLLFGAVSGIVSTRASLAGAEGHAELLPQTARAIVAMVVAYTPAAERSPAGDPERK